MSGEHLQDLWYSNAQVICNHDLPSPGVFTAEQCFYFLHCSHQGGGNTRDLCYMGEKGSVMKK